MTRSRLRQLACIALIALAGGVAGLATNSPVQDPPTARLTGDLGEPSTSTDIHGRFRFDDLRSSSHILRLDSRTLPPNIQAGTGAAVLTLSPGVTQAVEVAPGLTLRATYAADGTTLDGALFYDSDGNHHQGPAEAGLPGVRVIDPGVFQYYVAFNDTNLQQSFADQLNPSCLNRTASTTIVSTISLTGSAPNTAIYYDHWEDGYDANPTVPGPTTQVLTINDGQVQTWQNNIPTPRNPANLLYDGRDRITVVGEPVAAVRAGWLTTPGTLLAGAWEMSKVSDWGRNYIIPIGEDIGARGTQTFGDYDYVSASVMAAYDGTSVEIDPDANGVFNPPQILNAGETLYIRGSANQAGIAVRSGAAIRASQPVQVQVRAGNCRAAYSGRSYTLVPVERWWSDYWSPVSSFFNGQNGCTVRYQPPPIPPQPNASADVDIYIFNPSAAPLQVTYEDASGIGILTIPARSTRSYLNLHPNLLARRSNIQGVHLSAPGPFWAVTAVDSTSLGNNGADFDWSYALIPSKDLSSRVVISWSPGSNPPPAPPPGQVNGSAVFVQAVRDGTVVTVDLNGDGVPDPFDTDGDGVVEAVSAYGYNELTSNQGITLNRGRMVRVADPIDNDMTGASISTQDVRHPLAAVYGEDACIANYNAPFLDLGYTMLPLPAPEISKNSRLLIDADRSGDISPGDTLEYKIQVYNSRTGPIFDPVLVDTLPYTYTDFIVGSVTSVPAPTTPPGVTYDNGNGQFTYIPPGLPGSADPNVLAVRAAYPVINPGDGVVMMLRIILAPNIPSNVLSVVNKAELRSRGTPPLTTTVASPINQVDLSIHKTDGRTIIEGGDRLTYTLTYTNAGPGISYNTIMTDTLPPTALNISTPTVPGAITPTIDLANGRIYFQLGTLQPRDVGRTTVSITVAPNTPVGPVPNDVVISTRSHETNPNNNRHTDVDTVLPADLLVHKTDGRDAVARGQALVYTLTYTNAGPGIARNVILTDTLPFEALNVSTPTVPGVITPTLDLANRRIILRVGTLRPGQAGRTTLSLTVGPNTPTNVPYLNTIDIDSTTPDPNRGNNHHEDRNRLTSTTDVVLAEFGAEWQAGGVLVYWRTVAELDNYGFRVYRSSMPSRAGAQLITPQIIPGQGRGRAGGASYSIVDATAPQGPLYYWLEDIDLNGTSTFHGPAMPGVAAARFMWFLPIVAR